MLEAIIVLTLAYVKFFTLYKHITVVMGAVTVDFLSFAILGLHWWLVYVNLCILKENMLFHEHSEYFAFRKVTCILAYLYILLKLTLLKIQSGRTTRVQNLLLCQHFIEM